jgi:hypothetical protein
MILRILKIEGPHDYLCEVVDRGETQHYAGKKCKVDPSEAGGEIKPELVGKLVEIEDNPTLYNPHFIVETFKVTEEVK